MCSMIYCTHFCLLYFLQSRTKGSRKKKKKRTYSSSQRDADSSRYRAKTQSSLSGSFSLHSSGGGGGGDDDRPRKNLPRGHYDEVDIYGLTKKRSKKPTKKRKRKGRGSDNSESEWESSDDSVVFMGLGTSASSARKQSKAEKEKAKVIRYNKITAITDHPAQIQQLLKRMLYSLLYYLHPLLLSPNRISRNLVLGTNSTACVAV